MPLFGRFRVSVFKILLVENYCVHQRVVLSSQNCISNTWCIIAISNECLIESSDTLLCDFLVNSFENSFSLQVMIVLALRIFVHYLIVSLTSLQNSYTIQFCDCMYFYCRLCRYLSSFLLNASTVLLGNKIFMCLVESTPTDTRYT